MVSGASAYPAPYSPNSLLQMAKLGAVVGLAGAGAANLHRLQQGEIDTGQAALSTLRVGVASGLATAAATMVASHFRSPTLALAATLVTGTATMYALNAPTSSAADQDEPEPTAADTDPS